MVRIIISILLCFIGFQSHSQIGMFHAHNQTVASTPPLLDVYSGARWCYSFRKLRTAYTGKCIRVRRESDNTESDIDFNGSEIDTNALKLFVGSSYGRMVTWYDQSGNTINAVQTDTLRQPTVVANGVVVRKNGRVALQEGRIAAVGSEAWIVINTAGTTTGSLFFALSNEPINGDFGQSAKVFLSQDNGGYLALGANGSGAAANSGVGTPSFWVNGVSKTITTRQQSYDEIRTPSGLATVLVSVMSINNSGWSIYTTARSGALFFGMQHYISELVMYHTDQSSNRTGIEANINSYHTIY